MSLRQRKSSRSYFPRTALYDKLRARVSVAFSAAILSWCVLTLPRGFLYNREHQIKPITTFSSTWFAMAQTTTTEGHTANCDGRPEPRPGAIYSTVGHVNYGVGVKLRADISIPGGCEVNLPIEVCVCISRCDDLGFLATWI